MLNSLILSNPRAAFWVISAFWILISVFVWGPLFAYLGYRVRMNREPDDTKRLKKEAFELREKLQEAETERDVLRTKRKAAQIALA